MQSKYDHNFLGHDRNALILGFLKALSYAKLRNVCLKSGQIFLFCLILPLLAFWRTVLESKPGLVAFLAKGL